MPIKLYYLDDEPELLELFSDLISSEHVAITTFSDPLLALDAIKANPPDLLFLDYRLPHTTGDQIALQVPASIPKVLITGDLDVTLHAKYEAKFAKPVSTKDVKAFLSAFRSRGPTG